MYKFSLICLFILTVFVVTGCGPSKSDIMNDLVSKEEGKLAMHIFSSLNDFDFEINGVHNSSDFMRQNVVYSNIHTTSEEQEWLKTLGIEEKPPLVLILDNEKIVFQTSDPEKLREFAKENE